MTGPNGIEELLRTHRTERFAPGFADRAMRRVVAARTISLGRALQRYFALLVPVAVAAIVAIGFRNVRSANSSHAPLVVAALGLPQVTLEAAYTFDAGTAGITP